MDLTGIIEVIERRRAERGVTQEALAEMAGVSRRTLNSFFSGKTEIGLRRLLRIAAALDLTLALSPGQGRPTESELAAIFHED
jgi:HTH-type transcriptional regulator/antitoxin HipB